MPHSQHILQRAPGFTLVELLVTISVAAILLGIAAPSFRDMSIRNRVTTYANEFISTINYARSEAVRTGLPVSICRSSNGTTCSGTWNDGWIIFLNRDNDSPAAVDATADPLTDETIFKAYGPLGTGYTLSADAVFATNITYRRDGSASSTGIFAVCHDGTTVGAKAVLVTPLRPRVAVDTNGDRIPNRDDTNNIASCAAPSGT